MNIIKILIFLTILFLISFLKMPYFYYQILHWVVCVVNGYIAWKITKKEPKNNMFWVFAIISIAFNPFVPFYFGKSMWIFIDLVVICFYTYFFITQNRTLKSKNVLKSKDNGIEEVRRIHYSLIPDKDYGYNFVSRSKEEILEYFSRNDIDKYKMQIGGETFELEPIERKIILEKGKHTILNEGHIGKYYLEIHYPTLFRGYVFDNKEKAVKFILNEV